MLRLAIRSTCLLLCAVAFGCSTAEAPAETADAGQIQVDGGPSDSHVQAADGGAADYELRAGFGPHAVGTRRYEWVDETRGRKVPVRVWYPAAATGKGNAEYLFILKGTAHVDAPPVGGGTFPLVAFSHGFQGAAEQSFTLTERLASWGYVVAAPDHVTNTILDFSASDELVAEVAVHRPKDVAYAVQRVTEPGYALRHIINADAVAVMGHSFGGWTSLLVSGATVDIQHSKKECVAGTKSDIMCPYTKHLADQIVALKPPIAGLLAAIHLAPGGFSSFGDGLAKSYVPSLIIGGDKDNTTPLDVELQPIYDALQTPRALATVRGAGHMHFTDVCTLPFAKSVQQLKSMCEIDGGIAADRAATVVQGLVLAFLDRYLKGESGAASVLAPSDPHPAFAEVSVQSVGIASK